MKYKIILISILAILLVIFALQNTETVVTRLWFWEIKTPRALLILSSVLGGVIIGMLSCIEKLKKKTPKKTVKEPKPEN